MIAMQRRYLATLRAAHERHGLAVEPVDYGTLVPLEVEIPHLARLLRTERRIHRIFDVRLLADPVHIFVEQIEEHDLKMRMRHKNKQRTPGCRAGRVLETAKHRLQQPPSSLQERCTG